MKTIEETLIELKEHLQFRKDSNMPISDKIDCHNPSIEISSLDAKLIIDFIVSQQDKCFYCDTGI